MAAKKERTKEQRIKAEKTRLKGIFKELDENKKKICRKPYGRRAGRASTRTEKTSGEPRKARRLILT